MTRRDAVRRRSLARTTLASVALGLSDSDAGVSLAAAQGIEPTRFVAVTKLRSAMAGAQWISPFGIPGPAPGAIPAAARRGVWARYRGRFLPVQTEHDLTYRADGSARHMAAHVRLPADYVAMSDVEIGYADGSAPPAPDWRAVTRGFDDDLEVEVSDYRPKIVAIQGHTDPIQGDALTITLKDSRGEQRYTRRFDDPRHWFARNAAYVNVTQEFRTFPQTIVGQTSNARATLKSEGPHHFIEDYVGQFVDGEIVKGQSDGSATVSLKAYHPERGGRAAATHPTRLINRQLARGSNTPNIGTVIDIFRDIGHAADGRYRCYKHSPIRYGDAPKPGSRDYDVADANLVLANCINNETRAGFFGFSPRATDMAGYRPDAPFDADPSGGWQVWTLHPPGYQWFLPIWPRWSPGDPEDYVCTVTLTRANAHGRTSEFTVQNGPSARNDVITHSGPAAVVQKPRARRAYRARWREGTPTARSPIFSGHQVRQEERLLALTDAAGAAHPHLVLRALVTFDASGGVIDRKLRFENSRMYAGAVDLHYDVVAIRTEGRDALRAEEKLLLRDLIHITGARWTWKQAKPVAFCDPIHFMKSGLIASWERHPELSPGNIEAWHIRTRGMHANRDSQIFPKAPNPRSFTAVGGFANAAPGEPLWPAPMVFDGSGGGRGELGAYSYWDWLFWSGDMFAQWEHMEALADNGWGAWPWYWRDERADGDWSDAPPHPYRKWHVLGDRIAGSPGPGIDPPQAQQLADRMVLGKRLLRGNPPWGLGHVYTGEQSYSLWTGTSYGGYGARYFPTPSHCPTHPARNLYLLRPEIWFLDDVEQYGRWHIMNSFVASVPRLGGRVGDSEHVAAISANNGNRGFSWPWRSANHLASLFWDGHPRQATYRRVCQDMANHFALNVERSYMGIYTCRQDRHSNNWRDVPDVRSGMPALIENQTSAPVNRDGVVVDAFKSYYVHIAAAQAQDFEVADVRAGITASRWLFRLMDEAPEDKWFWLFGVEQLVVSPHPNPDNLVSPTGRIYPREDVGAMIADWAGKTPAFFDSRRSTNVQGKRLLREPHPDFEVAGWTYVENYVTEAYHRTALLGVTRHSAHAGDRARARRWVDRLFAMFPLAHRRFPADGPYRPGTYERYWGAQGEILPDMLPPAEW